MPFPIPIPFEAFQSFLSDGRIGKAILEFLKHQFMRNSNGHNYHSPSLRRKVFWPKKQRRQLAIGSKLKYETIHFAKCPQAMNETFYPAIFASQSQFPALPAAARIHFQ